MSKLIIDKIKENRDYESALNRHMPHKLMCLLGDRKISISGEEVAISPTGDYMSVQDIRECLEFLVYHFGGKIKWRKD